MNQKVRIVADSCLKDGVYVSGANKPHYHKKGIKPGKDFTAEWLDIHIAKEGDFAQM
jgi:prolyl-tRNA synthetase